MLTIGITDTGKYPKYAAWLETIDDVRVLKLSEKQQNLADVTLCDGVILSGGEDVHPKYYGKPELIKVLKEEDINDSRDAFELAVIGAALAMKKPILGICRGLQIANVYFGGTLIPDIPSTGRPNHSSTAEGDQRHPIVLSVGSMLATTKELTLHNVNSAHHQSADSIGKDLKITGVSAEDGIVETLEWAEPNEKSFLLLVQWHPERMIDQENPMAANVKKQFMTAVRAYHPEQ